MLGWGFGKKEGREKVPAEETRALEERQQGVTRPPAPSPRGMVRFNFVGFAEDSIKIFPGNCPDFCAYTHAHTQVVFWGGVGHILLDKNACYRELSGPCRDLRKQGKYEDTYLQPLLLCPW